MMNYIVAQVLSPAPFGISGGCFRPVFNIALETAGKAWNLFKSAVYFAAEAAERTMTADR